MKRRSLLIFLVIAILWVASLAIMGAVVTPDTPLEQNPQVKNWNSSKSNTSSISLLTGTDGVLRIGLVEIGLDGTYQIGVYGRDSITFGFDDNGNIIVSEPSRNLRFDAEIQNTIEEAFSVWAASMQGRSVPIGIGEEGVN